MNPIPELELFEKARPCPKCGASWVRERWCAGLPECIDFFERLPALQSNHFHRVCDDCTFAWYEVPLDVDLANALRRCDNCYEQDGGMNGDVAPCEDCGGLYCERCAANGCLGCSAAQAVVDDVLDFLEQEKANAAVVVSSGGPAASAGQSGGGSDGGDGAVEQEAAGAPAVNSVES